MSDEIKTTTEKKIRFTSVKGVTFVNADGVKRQEILATMKPEEELQLVREKNNPFDVNAIQVFYRETMLGYISKDLAHDLAPSIDAGIVIKAYVKEVTGGTPKAPTRGLNIRLEADV
jgi:uncharacterized membrane-anchored protein